MIQLVVLLSYALLLVLCVFFIWKLFFAFSRFRMKTPPRELPPLAEVSSVSVCIPARNEVHAMTACLERVIASTYPKLEIIVLDDSSVDDTSVLIKSFAHAGVRFVEGAPLPDGWLGKNYAFELLRLEASGTYILYMDVDTQLQPGSISQLVSYAEQEQVAMVSVLPQRMDNWRLSVILSGLRYFWALILHHKKSPAVASNAWMINRDILSNDIGGFTKHRLDVQPEKHIAAALSLRHAYRFIIGTPSLGIGYEKLYSSFVETNIRLLYPMAGGRFITGLLAFAALLVLLSPLVVLVAAVGFGWSMYQVIALLQLAVFGSIYAIYLSRVWHRGWWLGFILWPVALAQDTILFVISVTKYASGTVTWKGRPIVAPKVARQAEQ